MNRMAAMLAGYEEEVRRTERMRTLAHLGGGIAHQLRNSATGCAMAVDLHADECPLGDASETSRGGQAAIAADGTVYSAISAAGQAERNG